MPFTRILKVVERVSQKILARTLRHPECDRFADRVLYPQVPPRSAYALTGFMHLPRCLPAQYLTLHR